MEGNDISGLDLGKETWLTGFTSENINAKLAEWDSHNRNFPSDGHEYVVLPFYVNNSSGEKLLINDHENNDGEAKLKTVTINDYDGFSGQYCIQFSAARLLNRVLKAAGYRVVKNELIGTEWEKVCLFGKIITLSHDVTPTWESTIELPGGVEISGSYLIKDSPYGDYLNYADIVPDWDVDDFITKLKKLFCVTVDFDNKEKTVSVYFNKSIFLTDPIILKNEIGDPDHGEYDEQEGFELSVGSQDDSNATLSNDDKYEDYAIFTNVDTYQYLPGASNDYRNKAFYVKDTGRKYRCENDNGWKWKRIGRLEPYIEGEGENVKPIDVSIPQNVELGKIDVPYIQYSFPDDPETFEDMGKLAFTFFQGLYTVNDVEYRILSADRYSLDSLDTVFDFGKSLMPSYLYEQLYRQYLNWDTYRKREFTKYFLMKLADVVNLKWDQRYAIDGVAVILNQKKFDLPYEGVVELNGYTL